jgi:hypothetical protein
LDWFLGLEVFAYHVGRKLTDGGYGMRPINPQTRPYFKVGKVMQSLKMRTIGSHERIENIIMKGQYKLARRLPKEKTMVRGGVNYPGVGWGGKSPQRPWQNFVVGMIGLQIILG